MKRLLMLGLMLAVGCTGCTRQIRLLIESGPCINPPDRFCNLEGTDSRVLELSVYQLKEPVDPSSIRWDQLTGARGDLDVLAGSLAKADRPEHARARFTVQRNERRTERIRRTHGTRFLLFVTHGRAQGAQSIMLAPLGRFKRREAIKLEYYDIELLRLTEASSPTAEGARGGKR